MHFSTKQLLVYCLLLERFCGLPTTLLITDYVGLEHHRGLLKNLLIADFVKLERFCGLPPSSELGSGHKALVTSSNVYVFAY